MSQYQEGKTHVLCYQRLSERRKKRQQLNNPFHFSNSFGYKGTYTGWAGICAVKFDTL